jgi:PPP family 3-phenylpropionic acid transporter
MNSMTHTALFAPSVTARHLSTMRVIFFLMYAGVGVNFTYLNVYYINKGLSGTQIGILSMVAAMLMMVGSSLWGYISDRTGQARLIMAGGAAGSVVIALIFPFAHTFVHFLVLSALFSLGSCTFFILADSTTLALLGEHREEYGRYRLGGTIGYILTSAVSGFIFERTGLVWMFPAYAVVMVIFIFVALRVPVLPVRPTGDRPAQQLGQMVRRPVWLVFALCSFLIWMAANGSLNFLGIAMKAMGAGDSLIGLAMMISAVGEIPFMFFSGSIMRRLGLRRMLWLSMLFFIIRIGLLGLLTSPAWAIAINLINGPAYVFFWNSAINYANRMAPDALKATAQGLFTSTTSLAGMVSALLCGWMFDTLGANGMFQVLAVFCLAAFLIFGLSQKGWRAEPLS